MNIDEISRLADLMEGHDLTELSMETADLKIKLKRGGVMPVSASFPAGPAPTAAPAVHGGDDGDDDGIYVRSPIVGTFYVAPAPDAPPFVTPGDEVQADTVVCIVEAMKVMNEIKAEMHGVIKRVLAENATSVEYGQPLFELERA